MDRNLKKVVVLLAHPDIEKPEAEKGIAQAVDLYRKRVMALIGKDKSEDNGDILKTSKRRFTQISF